MTRQVVGVSVAVLLIVAAGPAAAQDGAAAYRRDCASCHDAGVDRAPSREALQTMTAERVLTALESGAMLSMASRSSAAERRAIAQYVTGKSLSKKDLDTSPAPQAMCTSAGAFNAPLAGPMWNGWGDNTFNTRFQDATGSGITATDVPRLRGQPGRYGLLAECRDRLHLLIWDFDSVGPYKTVNEVAARGGSFDGPGPAIAGGMLVVSSGYARAGGMPGNVLLAFTVDGK